MFFDPTRTLQKLAQLIGNNTVTVDNVGKTSLISSQFKFPQQAVAHWLYINSDFTFLSDGMVDSDLDSLYCIVLYFVIFVLIVVKYIN